MENTISINQKKACSLKIFNDSWTRRQVDDHTFILVRGEIWIKNVLYRGEAFAGYLIEQGIFSGCKDSVFLQNLIPETGNFAYIAVKDSHVFSVVDRVRSIPLFYGEDNSRLYLSDNAYWVQKQIGDGAMNLEAREEFRFTGFVTGSDTLSPHVKQLQAGESLFATKEKDGISIKQQQYFKYCGRNFFQLQQEDLLSHLDTVFVNSFRRLTASADGRTLVVPLSGGLDSRLVVAMLRRLNYKNVICFSYGKKDYWECEESRKVAKELNFSWIFIEYTRKKWRQWYKSPEFKQYFLEAGNLASLPHIDDWPAVWELKQKNLVPKDCIFVPGHTGDFISGGHIPPRIENFLEFNHKKLIQAIIRKHYRIKKWKQAPLDIQNKLWQRIEPRFLQEPVTGKEELGYLMETFDWQERQAKYITNSLRVYEFWKFDWRIPLWDSEIIDFWIRVPFSLKVRKNFYKKYLANTFDVFKDQRQVSPLKVSLKKSSFMQKILPAYHKLKENLYPLRRRFFDFFTHPFQYYGAFRYHQVGFLKGWFWSMNTFLVDEYLNRLKKRNENS